MVPPGQIRLVTPPAQAAKMPGLKTGLTVARRFFPAATPLPNTRPLTAATRLMENPNLLYSAEMDQTLASFETALDNIGEINLEQCIPDQTCAQVEERHQTVLKFYQRNREKLATAYLLSPKGDPATFIRHFYIATQYLAVAAQNFSPLPTEKKLEELLASWESGEKTSQELLAVANLGAALELQGHSIEQLARNDLAAIFTLNLMADNTPVISAEELTTPEKLEAFLQGLASALKEDSHWQLFIRLAENRKAAQKILAQKRAEEAEEERIFDKRLETRRREKAFFQRRLEAKRQLLAILEKAAGLSELTSGKETLGAILLSDPQAAESAEFKFWEFIISLGLAKLKKERAAALILKEAA